MFASLPDLLRLVAVPFFGYVAYRDVETRRVPNRTWYPLAALGVVLLVWDGYAVLAGDATAIERQRFVLGVAFSLLFVVPLVYGFWLVGGFGGADAKAFFVVALLFPVFPAYDLWELGVASVRLPLIRPTLPAFSLTILSNTVVAAAVYPVGLAARNAVAGRFSPAMFVGKPIRSTAVTGAYGSLLDLPDRSLTDDLSPGGLRSYFGWRGLDADALRMYLRWRGLSLTELRSDPERFRDPASLPADPNPPGDGAIVGDEQSADAAETGARADRDAEGDEKDDKRASEPVDDPWGAAAFLDDIEGSAYGTRPEQLRSGLDALVERDVVWISPGIPFLVPLFVGLVAGLTVGDLLFGLLGLAGLA